MTDKIISKPTHICESSSCNCGMSRRDFLRFSALTTAGAMSLLLSAGDVMAKAFTGDDQPVRIGYLPITDAAPLLIAHNQKLFEEQGLKVEAPTLLRSWAQMVEAFVSGQVNVIHLLAPASLWVRYGSKFPAKVVAWNHVNGSALTVLPDINSVKELGGRTVAIPFWYSVHNIVLQKLLREAGLTPVSKARDAALTAQEVNLVVMPPAEMVSALASKAIAGYIVAEPFNANAELLKVGKILRFSGDVWQNHACCVLTLSERDINERPEWAQRVTNAIVKAQRWMRDHRLESAKILAKDGGSNYTPHSSVSLQKVLIDTDVAAYEQQGAIIHKEWNQRRIDFQPYPFKSFTEEMVKSLQITRLDGNTEFLKTLDPSFAAGDLVDDRFVRKAIESVGGAKVFGLPETLTRQEQLGS